MKKWLLVGCVAMMSFGVQAAQMAARQSAMGGVGVSSADTKDAVFYNPALLSKGSSGQVGIVLPSVGASVADPDDIRTKVDDLNDSYKAFDDAYSAYLSNPTQANKDSLQSLNSQVTSQLQGLSGSTGYASASVGAAVSVTSDVVSVAPFFSTYADVEALADVSENDFASYPVDDLILTVPVNGAVQSKAIGLGVLVSEFGVGLAKSFDTSVGKTYVGFSPKVQRLEVYNYVASAVSGDFSDLNDDQYRAKKSGFNLDVGVANDFANGFTAGLSLKNVVKQSVTSPVISGVSAGYQLSPQAVISGTYTVGGLTLSSDLDLVPQKRFTDFAGTNRVYDDSRDDVQPVAVGVEQQLWGWLQLRAGVNHDLKNHMDDQFTAGFGISPASVFHLDFAGMYGGSDNVGAAVQTSFTF